MKERAFETLKDIPIGLLGRKGRMEVGRVMALGLFAALSLSACATSSPILSYKNSASNFSEEPVLIKHDIPEDRIYRIYHRASTGFTPIGPIRHAAEDRATQFCQRQDKSMLTLGERISEPPYILGNWPRIEIVFACTDKPAPPAQKSTAPADDKYLKLRNLKGLLDDNVITQEEFQQEKKKVLAD